MGPCSPYCYHRKDVEETLIHIFRDCPLATKFGKAMSQSLLGLVFLPLILLVGFELIFPRILGVLIKEVGLFFGQMWCICSGNGEL
jgi:hypothetical protein